MVPENLKVIHYLERVTVVIHSSTFKSPRSVSAKLRYNSTMYIQRKKRSFVKRGPTAKDVMQIVVPP